MATSSIRTLFITRYIPYPPVGGGYLRIWQNINVMRKYGSVGIITISQENSERETIPGIDLWHHDNIAKRKLSYWDKQKRKFWWLRRYGLPEVDSLYSIATARELDRLLAKFRPELVIFEELYLYHYLNRVKRYGCRIIFDNFNIEADLFEQTYGKTKLKLPRLKSIEGNFARRVDQVWVCSEDDASLMQQLYKQTGDLRVIPNGVNMGRYDNSLPYNQYQAPPELQDKQRNILFLGQYNYPPNRMAAQLLIDEIYPKLKKIYPSCRLLLVGRNPNKDMIQAAEKEPGIIVTGSVPDVRPYLAAASMMIVPLLKGSGTRLKIIEAFAASCPVVSTTRGAKGLKAVDGEHLLIRDSTDELVAGVCQLWSEPSLRAKLSNSAYELAKAEYSWEAVINKVDRSVEKLWSPC